MNSGPGSAGLLWLWATVVGNGGIGYSGEGGPGVKAELNNPYSAAVDGAGNQVIADTVGQRIRELTGAATPGPPARG